VTSRRRLTPAQAQRRAEVVALRTARLSFAEIGQRLGVTSQRAGRIYSEALAAVPRANVDEHRCEELELIDTAVRELMVIAGDPATSTRDHIRVWEAIRAWAERKAKLLGLDAPTRTETLTLDRIDSEIDTLSREMATTRLVESGTELSMEAIDAEIQRLTKELGEDW